MKRIIFSFAVILITAGALLGGTTAFFSDTETSTNNRFTAGALDLKVDNESYYNMNKCAEVTPGVWKWEGKASYPVPGTPCTTGWNLTDLDEGNLFFDFTDVKPDDEGEDTISLHVQNDAYACMDMTLTKNDDVSSNEPELKTGDAEEDAENIWDGELAQAIQMLWWADDGDNVYEVGENVISGGVKTVMDLASTSGAWSVALADATHNVWGTPGPIPAEETAYLAKAWCFGTLTPTPLSDDADTGPQVRGTGVSCDGKTLGNVTQTDSATLDIQFRTEQARHNGRFICGEDEPTPENGTITVVKEIKGGDAAFDDFSFVIGEGIPTPFDVGGSNQVEVAPGTYDVVETPAEGYTATYANSQNENANCDDLVVPPEGNVTCTITNTFVPVTGTLIVKKEFVDAPEGTDVENFSFSVNGEVSSFEADGENQFILAPGNYDVIENADDDYTTSYSSVNGANCTDVPVVGGQSTTCTITNTYDPSTITIEKIVVGGTLAKDDFTFSLDDAPVALGTHVVAPGQHLVEETNLPSDYMLSFSGACDSDGNMTVAPHEDATCTLTNTYAPTILVIQKSVVGGGGASAGDFSYTLNGNPTTLGAHPLTPGNYTVGEVATSHYVASFGGDCDQSGNVSLAQHQSLTCQITNTYDPTTITINKVVVGGNAQASDFSFEINGGQAALGENKVEPGAHTVAEVGGPANYTATYSGDCNANGGITAVVHENRTCTVTNTYVPPTGTLNIVKTVVNGPLFNSPQSFSYQIDGGSATAFDADGTSTLTLAPGVYDVTEVPTSNYVTTYWNGTSATCNDLVVTQNGTTNCWITNTFTPTTVTVQKTVIGGTATTGSFTYRIDGTPVAHGLPIIEAPGLHTVTETGGPANYVATFGGACNSQGQVTAILNQNVTCTITNTFTPATTTILTDNFGTGDCLADIPGWNEDASDSCPNGTVAKNTTGAQSEPASPDGGRFALLSGNNGYLCRSVNASGLGTLKLSYYWKGDTDADSGETGSVAFYTGGTCASPTGFVASSTHALTTTTWQTVTNTSLPGSLNNTTFLLKFTANSNGGNESFRVDGVTLTGIPL